MMRRPMLLTPLGSTRWLKARDKPRGVYDADDLALFARYRDQRQERAPQCCDDGAVCWVRDGPPAITQSARCRGCNGAPR